MPIKNLDPEDIHVRDGDFERAGRSFEAQYSGTCTISNNHKVKRGDRVSRVRMIDNPLIPVPGVACASCTKTLPRGAE